MTTKKRILISIGILILIPVVYIFIHHVYQLRKTHAANSKVAEARSEALKRVDQEIAGKVEALKQAGLVTDGIAFSKTDICYITHEDQGWFASNWYQDCYIRYVQGFTTDLSKEEALQKAGTLSEYFGDLPDDYLQLVNRCELAADSRRETARYRPAGSPIYDRADDCGIPNQLQATWSVRGPGMLDDQLSVHRYSSFDSATIGSLSDQVWIMSDTHYYHEDLGCGFGIFCESPRSKPAHPAL